MEDEKIIDLYWERSEQAVAVTQEKYHSYCYRIAHNILYNREDSEECVNDTWMCAWNSMPQERPGLLGAFLGKITRNISLDLYRKTHAKKRGSGECTYIFDELTDCVQEDRINEQLDRDELAEALNHFLERQKLENRIMFVRRYWYMDSIADIAGRLHCGESRVKSSLMRTRAKLRDYLREEGIEL